MYKIKDDPEVRERLEEVDRELAEDTFTAEMMEAAEEMAREEAFDETEARFNLFEDMRQLSARELEAYTEKKRQQFDAIDRHREPERWRTIGSLLTAGYTMLARMS